MNEVTILRDLSHPGVVKLLNVFQNGEIICVVMEKMNGGDLVNNFLQFWGIFMNEVMHAVKDGTCFYDTRYCGVCMLPPCHFCIRTKHDFYPYIQNLQAESF